MQDKDQDHVYKTKTKTKTSIQVVEEPRDQGQGLEDYNTGDAALQTVYYWQWNILMLLLLEQGSCDIVIVTSSSTMSAFCKRLKTHLFRKSYQDIVP